MNTKEFVIDDETMEELREVAKMDGERLEDLIERYVQFITKDYKKLLESVPPEVRAMQRRNKVPAGFNWKEELSDELHKKYVG
jgi:actin-like ATPase involved in cell morphogenesis